MAPLVDLKTTRCQRLVYASANVRDHTTDVSEEFAADSRSTSPGATAQPATTPTAAPST